MSTGPDGGWPPFQPGPPPGAYGPGAAATPVAGTANQAADWKWRLLHSWWLLLPILGCGCVGGFGFVYVGVRARRPQWWIAGIGYAVLSWAAFASFDAAGKDSAIAGVATAALMAIWLGGIVHALLINPAWLRWLASYRPWYHQPTGWTGQPPAGPPYGGWPPAPPAAPTWAGYPPPGSPTAPGFPPVSGPPGTPAPAAFPPVSGPPAHPTAAVPHQPWGAPTPPGSPVAPAPGPVSPAAPPAGSTVEVNTAGADQFAALPGFDAARVHRVLAERDARRGYGSVAEFVAAAHLAPHEYARLRDVLVCVPPAGPATPPGQSHGRVLDL